MNINSKINTKRVENSLDHKRHWPNRGLGKGPCLWSGGLAKPEFLLKIMMMLVLMIMMLLMMFVMLMQSKAWVDWMKFNKWWWCWWWVWWRLRWRWRWYWCCCSKAWLERYVDYDDVDWLPWWKPQWYRWQ